MSERASSGELEIRCFCSRRPLLVIGGKDSTGEPYVHLKVYKQRKLYAEMVATRGVVRVRCRECLRWHRITIRESVASKPEPLPERIPIS